MSKKTLITRRSPMIHQILTSSPKQRASEQSIRLSYARTGSWPATAPLKTAAHLLTELMSSTLSLIFPKTIRLNYVRDSMRNYIAPMVPGANSSIQRTILRILLHLQMWLIRKRIVIKASANLWILPWYQPWKSRLRLLNLKRQTWKK